ncbi:hypothetical protein HPB48_012336 [Haemaphysalis longicornis]|uniref:Nab N-terminal domain-containing protein n=1 Tax=Haemaphysalis longicornis TaxID=44386 RepID=A0A9J6G4A1_HAELO|nr:hypothetical protein HPB48_012336 [Haemaphysalis longicornis]
MQMGPTSIAHHVFGGALQLSGDALRGNMFTGAGVERCTVHASRRRLALSLYPTYIVLCYRPSARAAHRHQGPSRVALVVRPARRRRLLRQLALDSRGRRLRRSGRYHARWCEARLNGAQCRSWSRGALAMTSQPTNESELQLYRVLQRANLLSYYDTFICQGGDDVQQLCEAGEEEFLEIMALVGMASKPLHVRRLQKALQEWVNNPGATSKNESCPIYWQSTCIVPLDINQKQTDNAYHSSPKLILN